MTQWTMNIWAGGLQSVAAFMKSLDSLASRLQKVREMMMRKAVEVRTAFWDTGEEAMDRMREGRHPSPPAQGEKTLTNDLRKHESVFGG